MTANPITNPPAAGPISPRGRGFSARRRLVAGMVAVLALLIAGCGGGETTTVAVDKPGDAETLNNVLGRELAAVRAYERTLPLLHGSALASAREFRVQAQEHTNAIVKALRGLGEAAEPEEEEIESDEDPKTEDEALEFLYELESTSIAQGLGAAARLTSPGPRSLLGSIAANQAQHLVLLRRALGADRAASIPGAFENGTTPVPSEMIDE